MATQLPLFADKEQSPTSPAPMFDTFLMVDFENVRDLALSQLPDGWRVRIFIGRSQNNIPFALANEAQRLGDRLEWIKIAGDGRNNLDFHLAYYLGRLAQEHPFAAFVILSKDHGYDALIAHLVDKGIQCKRIGAFADIGTTPPPTANAHFTRTYAVLSKINKKSRPRRRKTLVQLVTSIFQRKLRPAEVEEIVARLFSENLVTEANNALSFHF